MPNSSRVGILTALALTCSACLFDVLGDDPPEFAITLELPAKIVDNYSETEPGLLVIRSELGLGTEERHLTVLCGEREGPLRYEESFSPTTFNCTGPGKFIAWIEPLELGDEDPPLSCGDAFEDVYDEHVDGPPSDVPKGSVRLEDDCKSHSYEITVD